MTASNDKDKVFINRARHAFDASVDQLDHDTLSEIAERRNQAIRQSGKKSLRYLSPRILLPAGAMATVVLSIALYFSISSGTSNGLKAEDLDMLSSSESLEFYEDLEFYQWLDENDLAT